MTQTVKGEYELIGLSDKEMDYLARLAKRAASRAARRAEKMRGGRIKLHPGQTLEELRRNAEAHERYTAAVAEKVSPWLGERS